MEKKQLIFTYRLIIALLVVLSNITIAQVPPAGKYNTSSYTKDRKAIEGLNIMDSSIYFNDDYIAVGPEGRISFGFEQWKKGFNNGTSFKSVTPVPGTYVLRIYNGDAAVRYSVLDVVFSTPKGDLSITVIRTETYIKQNGKWYFVSGQGTRAMSEEERQELIRKSTK